MGHVSEEAASVLSRLGGRLKEVSFPSPDDVVRDAIPLCGVEVAVAHEATYPSRAAEYGPLLTGLLEAGRAMDGQAMAKILLRREAFRGLGRRLDRCHLGRHGQAWFHDLRCDE